MTVYRAAWVCPISDRPVANGWFAVDSGRITAVGREGERPPAATRDLGRVAVLPGLVNAHTHLELSWLRGRVPPAASFLDWIKQLFATRGGRIERADDPMVLREALSGAREARESGTAAIGDISNSLASVGAIRDAGLRGLVFHELLGFNVLDAGPVDKSRPLREAAAAGGGERVRVSVAPHAPYSVSAELFRAIRAEVDRAPGGITSVHLAESVAEIEFLADGSGPWPGMLRFVGAMREDWTAPAAGPVEYLDGLGMLNAATLVVHGVQLDLTGLARLAKIGCTLVTCPRSNQWVGVGVPPIARFYESGVSVAVGTDSLASVDDLNLFAELETMRWLAPGVAARQLLESATLTGAAALGLASELGSIEIGKRDELIAVELPAALDDVEEYLVSGIDAKQIRWVTS
jgi:cytosine/adenosine deaminase-related metal-dependent hydrolase